MPNLRTPSLAVSSVLVRSTLLLVLASLPLCSCWNGTEPPLSADIRLVTDFEGASLGWFSAVGPREFYISIRHDTYSGFVGWYSFRIRGGAGQELTFWITNANQTSSEAAWAFAQPVVSADGGDTWTRITDTEYQGPMGRFFRFRYKPQTDLDWIAFAPVYNYSRWNNLVEEVGGDPFVDAVEVIAESHDGNPIHLLRVTDPSVHDSLKSAVWVVARQHAADAGSSWMAEGLLRWLLGHDPEAARLVSRCELYLIPFMNPDGVLRGNYIANGLGVNLNRQWANPDSTTAPSVFAVMRLMSGYVDAGGSVILFVDLQNQASSHANFLYYNGPDDTSPEMAAEIQDFVQVLNRINPDIDADGSVVWTGGGTVASRWAADALGVHGIMLEGSLQDVDYGPFQGEYMTVDRYIALGEALGKAIAEFFYPIEKLEQRSSRTPSDGN